MTVKLLHATPIEILDSALTKCWGSDCKTGDAMDVFETQDKWHA